MARKITIEFLGDSSDLQRAMNDAEGSSGRLTGTLGRFAKTAGFALGAGLAVGAKGLYDATQAAGDLNETVSKTNVIFGSKSANQLVSWAGDAAQNFGMSKQAALDAAATFGTFGKAAGKSGQDLRNFAMEQTALAADLASFNNTTPEEAIQAIGSALRGESEPLRAYGVLLDDASMRQEALAMGLTKTTKDVLTPQQKVLAAQSLIMKQTTAAQGDFERTSGSLANQQRILKADLANTSAEIGAKLLPVGLRIVTWLNAEALPAFQAFGGWLGDNIPPVFERIRSVVSSVMNAMQGDVGGGLGQVQAIFASVTSIITTLWDRFGGTITDYAVRTFDNVRQIIGGALDVVSGIFKTFSALLTGDWSGAWDGIKQILSGAWEIIKGIVKQGLTLLSTAMDMGWAAIRGIVSGAWDGIKMLVSAGISGVVGWVQEIPGKFRNALSNLSGAVSEIFSAAMAAGRAGVVNIGQDIVGWVAGIPDRLRDKLGSFRSAGADLIGAVVDGMKNAGGVIEGIASNVWNAIRGLLNAAIDKINASLEFTISLPGKDISINPPDIGQLARGTDNWRGGLAVVGEEGPELVDLPRGSRVTPHGESMGMLRGLGGSAPMVVQLVVDGRVLEQILIQHTRRTGEPLAVHTLGPA